MLYRLSIIGRIGNCQWLHTSTAVCAVKKTGAAGKAKLGKGAAPQKKERMEVETDAYKLANYVCGANYFVDGQDPKIKPDSEYPEWLWELRTSRQAPHPDEVEFDTLEYWRRIRKIAKRQEMLEKKMKHKFR